VNEGVKDRLHAIVAASVALRYLLEFDSEDWRTLPLDVQDAINGAAVACDGLASPIMEVVDS
jgi:hypothetical protein